MNKIKSIRAGRILLSFLLLLSLVFVTACSPSPAEPIKDPKATLAEYFPLQVGSSWQYEGIGNEFASYTSKVTHQKDSKGQIVLSSGTVTANRYEITENSILHTYQQHEFYEDASILDNASNIDGVILKLPLEIGSTWTSQGNTCEIIDTKATVETPAGTFQDCIAVKTTYKDSGNHSVHYYAKGIGLVKSEYVMPEQKVISQLSSYTTAK